MTGGQRRLKGPPVGNGSTLKRSAFAILHNDSERRKRRIALLVGEKDSGSSDPAADAREIRPAVPVEVAACLPVVAPEQRPRPRPHRWARVPPHHVATCLRGDVDEELLLCGT